MIELKFGRKKICFTVLYRSPAFDHNSSNFQAFLSNFRNLYVKIKAENHFSSFYTGDFNAHSQFCWSDGDSCIGQILTDHKLIRDSGTRDS